MQLCCLLLCCCLDAVVFWCVHVCNRAMEYFKNIIEKKILATSVKFCFDIQSCSQLIIVTTKKTSHCAFFFCLEGRVRLMNLTREGSFGGRVELQILGQWGVLSERSFDIQAGHVVCRQLGYPSATGVFNGDRWSSKYFRRREIQWLRFYRVCFFACLHYPRRFFLELRNFISNH